MLTSVEVEHSRSFSFHSHGDVVSFDVSGADASVGQHDLEQLAAALHVVQREFTQTRLDVCLIRVERLVEDVLHDLSQQRGK